MRIISGKAKGTKLYTLEGDSTRPTLDRVKEPLFSIIQTHIFDAYVLDLFSGSGALGLEALSRGACKAVLCDNSKKAMSIIKQNVEKTKFEEQTQLLNMDYKIVLEKLKNDKVKFDLIFLDPPYRGNYLYDSIKKIFENDLLDGEGIIIAETDEDIDLSDINCCIYDIRKYGRVKLIFIKRKEC